MTIPRSAIVTVAIIASVFAVIGYANHRERERSRVMRAAPSPAIRAAATQAEGLLRQARVAGNAGLAIRAEEVMNKALAARPGDYEGEQMLSSIYLSQHRFREAVALAEQNRAARPADPINYGVIGDGRLELGEYDAAFVAFDRMMQLRPSAAAYARVAYARELQGDLAGAVQSMTLAVDATGADDREGLAWAHSQVGELHLQQGHIAEARQAFVMASQAYRGHPFAVLGYAKVLAAEGHAADALQLLESLEHQTPDVHARMGDLLERLGRRDEAAKQFALAEAAWRSEAPEPKNLAKFLADHGKAAEAVVVAEQAAAARQDIFTEDALAWSYFKAGRVGDARTAMARALRTGTRDRDIRTHADAIAASAPQVAMHESDAMKAMR